MGVYTRHKDSVAWREQYIYGSSRLGLYRADTLINKGLQSINKLYEGKRQYELTNHLGNVMAVINDRRTDSLIGSVKTYNAVVVSAFDYYPFGLTIDSRSYSSAIYRYGFNGKENDKEWGKQDYGGRILDPSIGRWLSIDPLALKHSENSPYQSFANNPLLFIDPDGNDNVIYIITLPGVPKLFVDKAIEKANSYLRLLGLKTQVVRAAGNFDISKLTKTDGMVVIGNDKKSTTNYVLKNPYFKGIVEDRFLDKDKNNTHSVASWNADKATSSDNPEISSENLSVIALDGISGFTKSLQVKRSNGKIDFGLKSSEEAVGLIILHSAGHQSGDSHHSSVEDEKGFMAAGTGLILNLNGTVVGLRAASPATSVEQLFNGDTTGHDGTPRTPQYIKDKMKDRFQPNNEEPKATANPK